MDVGRVLPAILNDDQAQLSDRLLAAELASEPTVIDDTVANALLSIVLEDREPEELRAAAAASLGPALEEAHIEGFDDLDPISRETFHRIRTAFRELYPDLSLSKLLRRRILEASPHAPQPWHRDAIAAAFADEDLDWKRSAVFCMRSVDGFDDQVVEALPGDDEQSRYLAVCAAGEQSIDAAWPHIVALVSSPETDKPTLLAAIEAAGNIRPEEAEELLIDLDDSDDDEVADAVDAALFLADGMGDLELDDDDDSPYV